MSTELTLIKKENATFLPDGGKVAIDFPELGFSVLARRDRSFIDYKIFKRFGDSSDPKPTYETLSCNHVQWLEHEEEWQSPVPFMTGFVKWDGCSEWDGINSQFKHFCDDEPLLNVGKILYECWHLTAKLLETWD